MGRISTPDREAEGHRRAEAKAQLMLRLRARGLRDLSILRALETIPRENFVGPEHIDLALRDVAVPLPCGQTLEAPSLLAQILAAARPEKHHRILEIGAGSGYSAAVLSLLGRDVLSFECFQSLAVAARTRLERLNIDNVNILWADGRDVSPGIGLFDRILIHAAPEALPSNILGALGEGGVLIAPRQLDVTESQLIRYCRNARGDIEAETLGTCRAQKLLRGLFKAL